jgi:hypothetical protein
VRSYGYSRKLRAHRLSASTWPGKILRFHSLIPVGIPDFYPGDVKAANTRVRCQTLASSEKLGESACGHNNGLSVSVQHLLLGHSSRRTVADRAYRMEWSAHAGNLNGAGRDRPILLDQLDHGLAMMFDRRVVGTMKAPLHNLLDLDAPRDVVRSHDVRACPGVGGDVDLNLLIIHRIEFVVKFLEEAQIFCMPVSRWCESSPVVQFHCLKSFEIWFSVSSSSRYRMICLLLDDATDLVDAPVAPEAWLLGLLVRLLLGPCYEIWESIPL